MNLLRHIFIGPPLPTQELQGHRLDKLRALAAFSPDALSSIAYANQEIFLALAVTGSAGLALSFPIGVAITVLLVLVALSYYQTIKGYPSGGGSYIVAKENLGTIPGLTAGGALLVGYTLTAAVSLTTGVAAIASSFPVLWGYKTPLALFFLVVITLINLRGTKETGTVMAVPVYFFLATYLLMIGYGFMRAILNPDLVVTGTLPATEPLTTILILEAFSAGCTALTGIEAISNGVPVFKKPEVKNAGQTLLIMALLMAILFIGSLGLTQYLNIIPNGQETILSALARRVLGTSLPYILIQISSMLILVVAANTSFSGFPRLVAILSKDGFLPRQLTQLGDRLVYSNGILLLSLASAVLIILFKGDSHALVPLFAVGVFLAFTLSQSGMVLHWLREKGTGWPVKMVINTIGALATGAATLIIGITKFTDGAWISLVVIPILVIVFRKIKEHYKNVARQLSTRTAPTLPNSSANSTLRVVLPVSGVHNGVIEAVQISRQISSHISAVYIEIDPEQTASVQEKWKELFPDITLAVIPSPYRSIIQPLLDYLDEEDLKWADGQLAAVVLTELIPKKIWHTLLHNHSARLVKNALLYRRRHQGYQRVIIEVPFHLEA